MKTNMFSINGKDVLKGLAMAALSGAILPVSLILQEPSFTVANANWALIGNLALNGAITGFFAYIVKNFFSDSEGKLFGKIG